MRKRVAVLAAAVALLAPAATMVAPAVAGSDEDNGDDKIVLRLAEKLTDDERFSSDIDVGEQGFSVGDYFVLFKDPFFNRALTRQLGTVEGDCVVVDLDGPTFECDLTVLFNDGPSLTIEGPLDFAAGEADWAVTGGTGRYKTARGELHLDFSSGVTNLLTFTLFL
jgi:hypothetical protein